MKKLIFSTLIGIVFLSQSAFTQPTFEKIFRVNNRATEVHSVFPQTDGFMLVSTHGKGIVNFSKLDKNGEFVSGKDVFNTNSGFIMSASETSSGSFLISGVAYDDDSDETGSQHGFFLKVSSTLSSVSAIELTPFAGNGDSWASGAIETSDGSVLILAKSTITSVAGVDNYFELIKLKSNLNEVVWQKAILAGSDNTVFDLAETSAGYEIYGAVKHKDTNWNLYLGTISKDGATMKRQLIIGGNDWDGAYDLLVDVKRKVRNYASSIVKVDANTLAVAAYTRSFGNNSLNSNEKTGNSILLMSYPVSGNSYNWTAILDGANNEQLFGRNNFISLSNGDLLLAGYTNSTGSETPYPGSFMYRFAANTNGTITPKWQHVFTPPKNMLPFGLAEAADGTLLLSGTSAASTAEGVIIQTTAEGINPAGCISVNESQLALKSISLPVMSTTDMGIFDGTLHLNTIYGLSNSTSITTVCSANSSDEAIVPKIETEPLSQTVASGQSATLSVLATGTPPISYQWYEGESGDISKPVGIDSTFFSTPLLTNTTNYWVQIKNEKGEINSATAIINIENSKWLQETWPDWKEQPHILTLDNANRILVTSRDVITQFGPNDWPCGSAPGYLSSLNPTDGTMNWNINVGHSAPPAVAKDGSIYTNIENRLYRINPETGDKHLVYTADRNFTSSPAIAADGTIFIGAGQQVLAINPLAKELIWKEETDKFVINHPTIGADGTVYVIPWIVSSKMYAFYPFKNMNQVKWTRQIQGFFSTPPVVGAGGVIYAGAKSTLYAINPESGTTKWAFTTPIAPAGYPLIKNIVSEPVISKNGTIYLSIVGEGKNGCALYAIHPDGYPKWYFPSGGNLYTSAFLADDETIYYPADKLYVLDLFGKELWSKESGGRVSPVIANDGTIYGCSNTNNGVYALEGPSTGVAIGHWPAFGHDPQNTNQHDDSFVGIPPSITVQPENQLIKAGETASFSITAAGDPVLTYQWYEGVLGDKSKPVGENSPTYTTPPISSMTNYWVEVENEFGKDMSITVMASTGNVGEVKWFYNTNPDWNREEDGEITGGIALGKDGSMYFGVFDARLYAMNPDGTLKWITKVQAHQNEYRVTNAISYSTPTIAEDGTIYITTLGYYNGNKGSQNFGFLWAINPDGSEKWRYETGDFTAGQGSMAPWLRGSAAIGHDGTIYIGSEDGVLHALNTDGSLKWKYISYQEKGWLRGLKGNSPVVGMDGTIYFVAKGEIELYDPNTAEIIMFAINPDGTAKWEYKFDGKVYYNSYPPAIGPDGKIYVDCIIYINEQGDNAGYIHAVNPDGTKAWQFHTGENVGSSVVIGADSTIYIAGSSYVSPASRLRLYALNPDGSKKWQFPKEENPAKLGFNISTPVIGADNNLYFGIEDDGHLYALRPDGTELWANPPYLGNMSNSSPVITSDGTLYTGTGTGYESIINGFLYAVSTNSFGVANSAWPMLYQNPHRTQRAIGFPPDEVPVITEQPQDQSISEGEAVKLTVSATGTDLVYKWFLGSDRSTLVGTGESFTTPDLKETTTYWVEVSNTIGIVNSYYVTVYVVTTGNKDLFEKEFLLKIYPNPVTSNFFIESDLFRFDDFSISLFDILGNKVFEKNFVPGNETIKIDTGSLKSGLYFCRILIANERITQKLIIQK